MSGWGRCEDCVPCEADGCDATAFCLSEPGTRPCPHDRILCGEHNLDNCADCRRTADRDASYARCMTEPDWEPHDLTTVTPTQANAANKARADADARAAAEVARTYGEAGATYAAWLESRKQ